MSFDEETEDEDFEELIKEVEKLENSYYFLKNEKNRLAKRKRNSKKRKTQASHRKRNSKRSAYRIAPRQKRSGFTQQAFSERKPGFKTPKPKIRRREHGSQREGLERATLKTTKTIIKGEISW